MVEITFQERTGKDFFDFSEKALADTNLATYWAIENFVRINGKSISIEDIPKISDKYYMIIASQVFSPNNHENIKIDDDGNVIYQEGDRLIKVNVKEIKRDIITKMQANQNKKNISKVGILKKTIPLFFHITEEELLKLPYQIVAAMVSEVNNFLSEISEPRKSLQVSDDDFWIDSAKETLSE